MVQRAFVVCTNIKDSTCVSFDVETGNLLRVLVKMESYSAGGSRLEIRQNRFPA